MPALTGTGLAERPGQAPGPDFVQSLARGLAIIEAFGEVGEALTLAEAARRTGVSRATARRSLHTLETLGYVRCDGHRFSLAPRTLRLGFSYLQSGGLWQVAQPLMVEVVEAVHESCSAGVLDGSDVVYVARVPTQARVMSVTLGVGSRLPAIATSMGRVLIAHLAGPDRQALLTRIGKPEAHTDQTRTEPGDLARELDRIFDQGYAIVDQELEAGLRSIAVPILDAAGRAVAALNVGTHAGRTSIERLEQVFLPALRHCAGRIHEALGGRPLR